MVNKKTDDAVKVRGVGLKLSEWEKIDEIADKLDMKPHALTQSAVRYFLKLYQEGKVKIKTETRKTFDL